MAGGATATERLLGTIDDSGSTRVPAPRAGPPQYSVVERTHAWITGHRRLSRDYERLPPHSEA